MRKVKGLESGFSVGRYTVVICVTILTFKRMNSAWLIESAYSRRKIGQIGSGSTMLVSADSSFQVEPPKPG